MASSNAIRAGRAFVELFADDKPLVRGLNAAKARLNAFGTSVAKIGAGITGAGLAIVGPLLASAKTFADVGSSLNDMSARTGIAVETLSELAYGVNLAGADMQVFEAGIRRMQRQIHDARTGLKSAKEAFAELHIPIDQLVELSPDEQFRTIADALARVDDATRKAALAQEIFGRGGTALLPLMNTARSGIEELEATARKLGLTMSEEDVAAADAFGDMLDTLKATIVRVTVALGSALAPVLSAVTNSLTGTTATLSEFVDENRELIRGIAAVGVALIATGAAITAFGLTAKAIGPGLGVAATAASMLGPVLAALVSPIGLVTTAVIAGVGAFLIYTETGQAALGALASAFGDYIAIARTTFQGVVDALAAGDLALAAEVAMAGIRVAFETGIAPLRNAWIDFADTFLKVWIDVSTAFRQSWADTVAGATIVAAEAGSAIKAFFENAIAGVAELVGAVSSEEAQQTRDALAADRAAELRAIVNDAIADNAAANRALQDARVAAQKARSAGTSEDIRAAEAALDRARKRLSDAAQRAAGARAAANATPAGQKVVVDVPDLDDLAYQLGAAAEAMEDKVPEAMAIGSKEAAEHILKSFAAPKAEQDLIRQQLKEAKNQTNVLKRIDKKVGKGEPLLPSTI